MTRRNRLLNYKPNTLGSLKINGETFDEENDPTNAIKQN